MAAELSDMELAARYGIREGSFDMSNAGAERLLTWRYGTLLGGVCITTLVVGGILLSGPIGHPIRNWAAFFALSIGVGVGISVPVGYLFGRSMAGLFVPKSISLRKDCLIGDFRRDGWPPPRILRMRFEDLQAFRWSPVLGVRKVVGSCDLDTGPEVRSFLLESGNFAHVERAYREWKESRDAEREGGN